MAPDIHNTVVWFSDIKPEYDVGEEIQLKCREGHEYSSGDLTRSCLLNVTWEGIDPECAGTTFFI